MNYFLFISFFVFTSSGFAANVGIGTTAPTSQLHVQAAAANAAEFDSTGANRANIIVNNVAGGQQSTVLFEDAGTSKWQIGKQTDNTFVLYDSANSKSDIQTNGTSIMLNVASGNVGIGTSAPVGLFDVNSKLTVLTAGNVGIGTTVPSQKLQVIGTAAVSTDLQVAPNSDVYATSPIVDLGTHQDGTDMQFALRNSTGSATVYMMSDSWNIGALGVSGPTSILLINPLNSLGSGKTFNNSNNAVGGCVVGTLNTDCTYPYLGIKQSWAAYTLDVGGDIRATGDGYFGADLTVNTCFHYNGGHLGSCASDSRLKKDIRPFTKGLEALMGIDPKYFKYNGLAGQNPNSGEQVGVIAQELEKTNPDLVDSKEVKLHNDDKDNTAIKTVNDASFVYIAINAIKDLYAKWLSDSHDLHHQIASLKAENEQLQNSIHVLTNQNEGILKVFCESGHNGKSSLCH